MASNYTENYQLCQWAATDQVQRVEFNEDNAKIANALLIRNCQLYTTTYVGTGEGGRSFTFPHKPMVVFVMDNTHTFMCAIQGATHIHLRYAISISDSRAIWKENTFTWTQENDSVTLAANTSGNTYTLVALLDPNQ